MAPDAGTLGKYQIIREIARSNDIVYEAYDAHMNRRVAVKELAVAQGSTEKVRQERMRRFEREARAAGSLAHPNIVTIYEVGEDNGRAFIAMEYLEGQNLRQRMDAEGALPQEEAVRIILEVLDGLAYAHGRQVVHRDIKPDNIQLLPDGRVKITDFGIARLMFEPSLTMDGQIFGTPSYMSPEQVVGREIDQRTDIWSAGVVLYEAIAGTKPFAGDSVVSISHAIMHREPPDPPGASFSVAQVIRRSLDKAPDQRYASAKSMAAALREALDAVKADPRVAPFSVQQQPSTYLPSGQMPWGAPLDPYAAPTPYTAPSQPVQNPYGQPYGQPYVTPTVPPPMLNPSAYPPGWTAPPKTPLFSPEVSGFLRRTFLVVLVFGTLVVLGAYGVLTFLQANDRVNTKSQATQIRRLLDAGDELRSQAVSSLEPAARYQLLSRAESTYLDAAAKSDASENRSRALRSAADAELLMSAELMANEQLIDARHMAETALQHAGDAHDDALAQRARDMLDSLLR